MNSTGARKGPDTGRVKPKLAEKILQSLSLWGDGPILRTGRAPPAPGPWCYEPCAEVELRLEYENVLTD